MLRKELKPSVKLNRSKRLKSVLPTSDGALLRFDTSEWKSHWLVHNATKLTEGAWKSALPKLKDFNQTQQAAVDERDKANARSARRSEVEELYASLPHSTIVSPVPKLDEFMALDSVEALWQPAHAPEVTSLPFDTITAELVVLKDTLANDLFHLIPSRDVAAGTSAGTQGLPPLGRDGSYERDAVLELVTSVFECCHPECHSAVDSFPSILSHSSGHRGAQRNPSFQVAEYRVSRRAVSYTRRLLKITSLDEATTTWSDVEGIGNRFSCVTCKPSLGSWCRTWKAMFCTLRTKRSRQSFLNWIDLK